MILLLCPFPGFDNQLVASSKSVASFESQGLRTLDALQKSARQEHVVIGVSGVLVGSDHTLISVNLFDTTIGDILNALVEKDLRYAWHHRPDEIIDVSLGEAPLGLFDVVVQDWTLVNPVRGDLADKTAAILVARAAKTYFWPAIEFSETPCDINFSP